MPEEEYAKLLSKVSNGYGVEAYALAMMVDKHSESFQKLLDNKVHLTKYLRGVTVKGMMSSEEVITRAYRGFKSHHT